MPRKRTLAALTATLLIPLAHAESLRCGNDLVRPGDTRGEVRAACGPPDRTYNLVNERGATIGQRAIYAPDPNRHARAVTYDGEEVTRVERLE
ncbi:Protein of unknown function [Thiohalospira halophila DSM 15071]|uniref:DUF2845 domain-containing protein n=1 Tax=Thiohalospira halophila DSM 15071 TaxID=1123397 RepID=A0A1I1TSN1_9GAMM|nr:DUF2845 domain-containing protein [Thiohalospira halophila]SFD61524.1 Protein of unknown function [Thiohalospira halophila DSM 15071]